MIRDVIIIKDGMPILSMSCSKSQNLFSQGDSLIMISGFFSALNSFSDQFEDLGTISELRLSKKGFKLSFLKDPSLPNLIYLATFDDNSKGVNVQRTLRKISRTFLKKYNINQILNWSGKKDAFSSFEKEIKKYVDEEKNENELQFKKKVIDLFKNMEEKIIEQNNSFQGDNSLVLLSHDKKINNFPDYCDYIPIFKTSKKIKPQYFLSGETSFNVFNLINGGKSISQIANKLNLEHERVYNICKNLVKLGFIILAKN